LSNIGASITKTDKNNTLSLLIGSVSHFYEFGWLIRGFLSGCYVFGASNCTHLAQRPTLVRQRAAMKSSSSPIFQQDANIDGVNKVAFSIFLS
jgi:uncharacterized membrane protein